MQWALWKELSCLSSLHIPYLIIGDFNAICSDSEHKGCSFTYYACKSVFFNDFIAKNSPLDFKFVGANFTWCNDCFGSARRFACLDRCLVNLGWIYFFDFYLVFYLSQILSDLAPLLLSVRPRHSTRHKVFLFETFWLEYLDCHSSIHLALNFTPLQSASCLLPFTQ